MTTSSTCCRSETVLFEHRREVNGSASTSQRSLFTTVPRNYCSCGICCLSVRFKQGLAHSQSRLDSEEVTGTIDLHTTLFMCWRFPILFFCKHSSTNVGVKRSLVIGWFLCDRWWNASHYNLQTLNFLFTGQYLPVDESLYWNTASGAIFIDRGKTKNSRKW